MDENLGYNIVTISDGTQYKVPKHLSKEAFAAVGRVDPSALRISGIFETFDDKFDYSSGVLDSALRGRLAIAQTFEEKAIVLNEKVGPNNWGFTDWSNEPFVTPQGYRNITGEEPPEGPFKNILIDATGTESWRDIIDIAPELFIGGASVASELLLPNVPGSGLVGRGAAAGLLRTVFNRGLSGRAVSAGTGEAVCGHGAWSLQTAVGAYAEAASGVRDSVWRKDGSRRFCILQCNCGSRETARRRRDRRSAGLPWMPGATGDSTHEHGVRARHRAGKHGVENATAGPQYLGVGK